MHGGHPAEAEPALERVSAGDLFDAHLPLSSPPAPTPPSSPLPGRRLRRRFRRPEPGVPPPDPAGVVACSSGSSASWWSWCVVVGVGVGVGCGRGRARRWSSSSAGRGRLRQRLRAQLQRLLAQVADAFLQTGAQARVDARRKGAEVEFGLGEGRFGGRAVPVARLSRLRDGFEVALQRPGVRGRDQARARAAAAREQAAASERRRRAAGAARGRRGARRACEARSCSLTVLQALRQ